ncbi:MAG: cytochrome c [Gammaproteobacteria bacterium]|nr:cytochrome c [Gammaproteobacteria bacterium]
MTRTWYVLAVALVGLLHGGAHGDNDFDALSGLALGRQVYLRYCAGCHGPDGLAVYASAPSFALGERMQRPDGVLIRSIRGGLGDMPSWENKLPDSWLVEALGYVRDIAARAQANAPLTEEWPDYYFIFAPMGRDITREWWMNPNPP